MSFVRIRERICKYKHRGCDVPTRAFCARVEDRMAAGGAASTNGASKLISSPPCASSEPLSDTLLPGEIQPAKGHTPGSGLGAGCRRGAVRGSEA